MTTVSYLIKLSAAAAAKSLGFSSYQCLQCNMHRLKVHYCIKISLASLSTILAILYVKYLIRYAYASYYNSLHGQQPPWPSSPANMVEFQRLATKEVEYVPKILCWVSTYPKNRLVRLFCTRCLRARCQKIGLTRGPFGVKN